MLPREFNQPNEELRLSATQETVAQSILDALKIPKSQARKIIVLTGLSGVGKTTVLTHIREEIITLGGTVVEPDKVEFGDVKQYKGHLVTTSTFGEFSREIADVARKRFPERIIETYLLSTMDEKESSQYLKTLVSHNKTLSQDQIVKYSLGIPLLIRQLVMMDLDEHAAAKVCSGYLWRSLRGQEIKEPIRFFEQNIKIPVPEESINLLKEMDIIAQHIYDDLHWSLKKMEQLRRKGILEESPLFVAPESERIYDAMLKSRGIASIDIFVPELTSEDLQRLFQAFGFDGYYEYRQDDASRAEMFPIEYRKVSFWHRDTNGRMIADENELSNLESKALDYVKAFKKGKLGMRKDLSKGSASFYIHAHGHNRETYHPATIGWMVESLLQQRGIAYFVNNDTYDESYMYEPIEKHIEVLPERVVVYRY